MSNETKALLNAYVKFHDYAVNTQQELIQKFCAIGEEIEYELGRAKLMCIAHDLDPDCSCSTCMEVARIAQMYI